MADSTPNYMVEQQRLRAQIAGQVATIEGQKLAILEMADRKMRHLENIEAARRAIADYEKNLAALQETHGELSQELYEKIAEINRE